MKKDLYFFGRTDLVHSLADRHKSGQVSGLFGLRKTGKTSVIFGIQRALERDGAKSTFVDCQNPAFHKRRWNHALHHVLEQTKEQHRLTLGVPLESMFTEEDAPKLFEATIEKQSKELGRNSILLIFDEVENITFGVSPSDHWSKGLDFVYFWQTLRSVFQKQKGVFTYLIVGTNPLCIEMPSIEGKDNPLHAQLPLQYIPRFDVPQTREMVRKLGRIMGLQFDEVTYGMLTEDFGGHPYLIRQVCSVINNLCSRERPVKVSKTTYEEGKRLFLRDYSHFIDMILGVLREHFADEYEMLRYLAAGDVETFKDIASLSPVFTSHLLGYGIIEESNGAYSFRIEAIQEHLLRTHHSRKLNPTPEEVWSEICEVRNKLEPKLRALCRTQLLSHLGPEGARQAVLSILPQKRISQAAGLSYTDLFNPSKTEIYLSDIEKLVTRNWPCFKHFLGPDVAAAATRIGAINRHRADAHAKLLSKEELQYFRVCAEALDTQLNAYFE